VEYPKIQTVFKRDPATKHKTLLLGDYSLPEFRYLEENPWLWTEKVDGTNIRIYFDTFDGPLDEATVAIKGRTDKAQLPAALLAKLTETFTPRRFIRAGFYDQVTLYGEGYGAKIQKGGGNYIPDGVDFVLFDVHIGDWWLKQEDVVDIARKLDIDTVPIIGIGNLIRLVEFVRGGFPSDLANESNRDFLAEGIVARPTVPLFTRSGHRIITKLKHKDFAHE
jgi:hypothetical protein